jgi:hypothetical protein
MKIISSGSRRMLLILVTSIVLFNTACGSKGFRDPISKFQAASSVVIASTRVYLTELNKVERDHYISSQLGERAQIKLDEIQAVQVFSNDGLKARIDALDQLANYGDLLSKLANSDAPERVRAQATDLGGELKKLSSTVSGLTHATDADFQQAVGPVTTIVGQILDLIVQQKIKAAIEKAINEGELPVNKLISTIRSDISLAYERKREALSGMRVTLVDEYNRELAKRENANAELLRVLAERVRAHEDRWEAFASANPGEGLDAMQKAHTALVKFAKSSHKVADFASLVDAMEAFAARAQAIGQAIQSLRAI